MRIGFLVSSAVLASAFLVGCNTGSRGAKKATAPAPATSAPASSSAAPVASAGVPLALPVVAQIPREVALEIAAPMGAAVRDAPNPTAPALGLANLGEHYVHLEQQGDWHRIQFGTLVGWVPQRDVVRSPKTVHKVTAPSLNVRSGAGTTFRQVGQLTRDLLVVITDQRGDWREVSFQGRIAWVHGAYLSGSGVQPPPAQPTRPTNRVGFIQLAASGDGFVGFLAASGRWGVPQLVYGIERAGVRWKRTGFPRMGIGHISREFGGRFPPHQTHRFGKNLDVRPVRTRGEGPITITQSLYSRSRTQQLIDLLRTETQAFAVLFNDRGVRGVRYFRGHHNHFHLSVR